MNQRAPGSAVPIAERVDRLELSVHQGGLDERRKKIAGDRTAEIVQEPGDVLHRRRYEIRAARVVVVATDPVLIGSEPAGDLPSGVLFHQASMDDENLRLAEGRGPSRLGNRRLHGGHVGQDVGRRLTSPPPGFHADLGPGQVSSVHLEALDFRRGDGLGSEQEAGKRGQGRLSGRVELADGRFGVRNQTGRCRRQVDVQGRQLLGDKRLVAAGPLVFGRRVDGGVELPDLG